MKAEESRRRFAEFVKEGYRWRRFERDSIGILDALDALQRDFFSDRADRVF